MRNIQSCPTCGREHSNLVYKSTLPLNISVNALPNPYSAHYQINRCTHCNLLRASPILDAAGVSTLYRDSLETNIAPGEEHNVQRTMDRYYHLARPFMNQKERMLDVGCDRGFLLEEAAQDGFKEMYGLEPVPAARQLAEQVNGAILSDKFYEETDFPPSFFDFIVMIHVLDHLVDPKIVLQKAFHNLKPGGIMLAVVHNVESLLGKILGEKFPPFNMYHFYYFSKKTLRALFEHHGFEVLSVPSTYNRYSLGFYTRRVPGLPNFIKKATNSLLTKTKLASIPITIPLGNIGIVARRPFEG